MSAVSSVEEVRKTFAEQRYVQIELMIEEGLARIEGAFGS